jgi:S1-C subfamily serine protease
LPTLLLLISTLIVIVVVRWGQRELDFQHTQTEVHNAALRLADPGGDGAVLASLSRAQRDLAAFVQPSVVHIEGIRVNPHRGGGAGKHTTGSGWIWDAQGHVVTAWHVVRSAASIEVQLHDGSIRAATVLASDPQTDIAVLSMNASRTLPATRATPPGAQQGDMVFAFGSPLDFRFSVTGGVVSGLGRTASAPDRGRLPAYENYLQIDAPINPGSSGGPVTDHLGHVVGMSTAIADDAANPVSEGRFTGVALAIPIEMIDAIVPQLIEEGRVHRGLLGIRALNTDRPIASILAAKMIDGGGFVARVAEDSPVFEAGLRVGDVIWLCNDAPLMDVSKLRELMLSGDDIKLEVSHTWRGDPLRPRVLDLSHCSQAGSGIVVLPMTDPIHAMLAALDAPPSGIVVAAVTPGGAAAEAGIARGDLITHIGTHEIRTVDQLRSVVSAIAPGTPVDVSLWRSTKNGGRFLVRTATLTDQAESQPG